jgi:hypothetical protein
VIEPGLHFLSKLVITERGRPENEVFDHHFYDAAHDLV